MKIMDINSLDQNEVYARYEMYKLMKNELELKRELSEIEHGKLKFLEAQLLEIENWSSSKLNEKLNWTKEEIYIAYGSKTNLIINFHPSTESYKKYGKEINVNIEFNNDELLEMINNINENVERKSSLVYFKFDNEIIANTFETKEIFEIYGHRI